MNPTILAFYLACSVIEGKLEVELEREVGAALDLEACILEVVAGFVARDDELVRPVNVNSCYLCRTGKMFRHGT